MRATLWSWCEEISYWNSLIISSKYAHRMEIRTSIHPSGVSLGIGTWIGRKKKGGIVKKVLYWCHEEVYSKFLIHFSLLSSSYHKSIAKICLVLTCWLTALDGAVFQVTRCMNVCRGKDFYHIQSIKKIDSNRLEIGAQTNIDIKLPYHWSRLLFFSFLLLPIITLSRTDQTQTRELNVKRCHNSTFDRKPVKLPSCEVVLQLETLSARSFAGRLFASLVVLLCTLLISLKK